MMQGYHTHGCWDDAAFDHELTYCLDDSSTQTAVDYDTGYFEDDLIVRCCDDSAGYSPDCNAVSKTYAEAVAICEGFGYRLCTYDELLAGYSKDTGCDMNCGYTWTSNECNGMSNVFGNGERFGSTLYFMFPLFVPKTVNLRGTLSELKITAILH